MKPIDMLLRLKECVIAGDEKMARETAMEAIESGIDPVEAINLGLAEGMKIVGDRFKQLEMFLPDVMISADAMKAAIDVLEPRIVAEKRSSLTTGKVVIGTVKGDVHDIGKNIVATMLRAARFEVHDLGNDVPPEEYISKAEEVNADIIGTSTLLSTSMPYVEDVIRLLRDRNLRTKYKVMVGGGPITSDWAEKIAADGFGKDIDEAVKVATQLMRK